MLYKCDFGVGWKQVELRDLLSKTWQVAAAHSRCECSQTGVELCVYAPSAFPTEQLCHCGSSYLHQSDCFVHPFLATALPTLDDSLSPKLRVDLLRPAGVLNCSFCNQNYLANKTDPNFTFAVDHVCL